MNKNNENLLQSLLIKNFKSVGETSKVDFRNLTLLCGNNSSGKSTIINSLILLAQQSHSKNKLEEIKFSLNGVVQQLGSIQSVKNKNAKSELSLGILGKNFNGNIFFQISLDELKDGKNIYYSKYITDYLEDYDGNPGDPVNYMTQAFELTYFENDAETKELLVNDLPDDTKYILSKYITLQNESDNYLSSLDFNAKEYEVALPDSLLDSNEIKKTFINKFGELEKEINTISESFRGVLFRDGFPSNQLKKPTKLLSSIMEDLKSSFLEYDWYNFSSELSEFLLDDDYEELFDFEGYLNDEIETKELNEKEFQVIISEFINNKEPISKFYKSLFNYGLPLQVINELNNLSNELSNESENLSRLLSVISLSLYGIDISRDKIERRKTSKRNSSVEEILTILFVYNLLNLKEFQQFGPIQEGMYEFIIASLITNSDENFYIKFQEIQQQIITGYNSIAALENGDVNELYDLGLMEDVINEAISREKDRYYEAGLEYDPSSDEPDEEVLRNVLFEMANEEIYQIERDINGLYDDFFKLLPIEVNDIKTKIEQNVNLKIFFYNNSDYQTVDKKQLETIVDELNSLFGGVYFVKQALDIENTRIKKFYIDSKFSIHNIDSNLLVFDSQDGLNQMYKETQNILNHVKYLGPLRDRSTSADSDKLYPEITPLGIDGENFIKHYEFYKNKKIETVLPYIEVSSSTADDAQKDLEETTSEGLSFKLEASINVYEAFNWWIKYFELGEYFKVVENTDKPSQLDSYIKPIDLDDVVSPANVGVGFSQIAPIILMCLTAEKNDILIFEQPELHLHPGLQQKLGDFFLQMSKLGIQIIIETHSDHILNRVRLRSFEDIESFSDSVNIVFVEKENNESRFNQFKITDDGDFDFETYPKGFFDQTSKDTFKLLKAKALKRQQKEKNELTEDEAPF